MLHLANQPFITFIMSHCSYNIDICSLSTMTIIDYIPDKRVGLTARKYDKNVTCNKLLAREETTSPV